MSRPRNAVIVGLIIVALALVGWRILDGLKMRGDEPLTVAAAANLQFAFTEIGRLFEEETGQAVVFSFGSSGNLARQIEHGAPVDVFASANAAYVDELRAKGLVVASSQQVYARGQLVLAVNRASDVQVARLQDLLGTDVVYVALANPAHAPYGLAAQQALQSAGLWEALQSKLVYGETVRQAMQFVQTGNAEAGLIALSVADVPGLDYTLVDAALYQPLDQVIAVVQATPRLAASERFIAFVRGPLGQRILRRYGFQIPISKD
jgi:molybdate transport system substrate-binding protein